MNASQATHSKIRATRKAVAASLSLSLSRGADAAAADAMGASPGWFEAVILLLSPGWWTLPSFPLAGTRRANLRKVQTPRRGHRLRANPVARGVAACCGPPVGHATSSGCVR